MSRTPAMARPIADLVRELLVLTDFNILIAISFVGTFD
jgi:hypothetical protein